MRTVCIATPTDCHVTPLPGLFIVVFFSVPLRPWLAHRVFTLAYTFAIITRPLAKQFTLNDNITTFPHDHCRYY